MTCVSWKWREETSPPNYRLLHRSRYAYWAASGTLQRPAHCGKSPAPGPIAAVVPAISLPDRERISSASFTSWARGEWPRGAGRETIPRSTGGVSCFKLLLACLTLRSPYRDSSLGHSSRRELARPVPQIDGGQRATVPTPGRPLSRRGTRWGSHNRGLRRSPPCSPSLRHPIADCFDLARPLYLAPDGSLCITEPTTTQLFPPFVLFSPRHSLPRFFALRVEGKAVVLGPCSPATHPPRGRLRALQS